MSVIAVWAGSAARAVKAPSHRCRTLRRPVRSALRCLSSATPGGEQPDVLVVGGGCAGLACAVALADSGVRTHLVDADVRLGGRARSWPDKKTGHPLHIGPHVVYSDYPNYFGLLKRLGTFEQVVWQRDRNVFVTINGERDVAAQPGCKEFVSWPVKLHNFLPPPLNWLHAVWRDPFVPSLRDTASLVPFGFFVLSLRDNGELLQLLEGTAEADAGLLADLRVWQKLDQVSGKELLDRFQVSQAYQDHIMAFCANAILNVPLHELSGAALVSFFRRLIGREGVALGFIDGGLGSVLEPAEAYLNARAGCEVRLNTRLTEPLTVGDTGAVTATLQGPDGVAYAVTPKAGVVLALPPLDTRRFLPGVLRDGAAARVLGAIDTAPALRSPEASAAAPQDAAELDKHSIGAVLAKFRPCKYISVYLWFDRDIREGTESSRGSVSDVAFSGQQFWAKRYHSSDLCCEFYDFAKIYTETGPAKAVLDAPVGWQMPSEELKPRASFLGVNMIDVERLQADAAQDEDEHEVCSTTGELSAPHARQFAGPSWTDDALVARCLEELHESVPTARHAKLVHSAVHRIPMAIPRPVVGTENSRPLAGRVSPDAGVFLAGDFTANAFPSCMETATESGYACADEVLAAVRSPGTGAGGAKPWRTPHPRISPLAQLPSRGVLWPAARAVLKGRLRGVEELLYKD